MRAITSLRPSRHRIVRWYVLPAVIVVGAYFGVRPWYDVITGETKRDRNQRWFVDLQDRSLKRQQIDRAIQSVEAATRATIRSYSATMKKYEAVKEGMYRWDVDKIVGHSGVEMLSSGNIRVYQWPGEDPGSGMTATFEHLKLVAKAQVGLK